MNRFVSIALIGFAATVGAQGRSSQGTRTLTTAMPAKVANREMQPVADGARRGVRLDARAGDGIAWWPDAVFGDCTIDVDLRGKDVLQQSFLGVAFHGVDEKTFDDVYFRPFNFKAADPARKSHAVQYEAHPGFTWEKLRADHPDQYERGIPTPPDPNGWFHARIVVASSAVRVFVNDLAAPVMDFKPLGDRKTGWVGVWVGNNSDGQFANLTVTPAR
jgi:hypothetical protein